MSLAPFKTVCRKIKNAFELKAKSNNIRLYGYGNIAGDEELKCLAPHLPSGPVGFQNYKLLYIDWKLKTVVLSESLSLCSPNITTNIDRQSQQTVVIQATNATPLSVK